MHSDSKPELDVAIADDELGDLQMILLGSSCPSTFQVSLDEENHMTPFAYRLQPNATLSSTYGFLIVYCANLAAS